MPVMGEDICIYVNMLQNMQFIAECDEGNQSFANLHELYGLCLLRREGRAEACKGGSGLARGGSVSTSVDWNCH